MKWYAWGSYACRVRPDNISRLYFDIYTFGKRWFRYREIRNSVDTTIVVI